MSRKRVILALLLLAGFFQFSAQAYDIHFDNPADLEGFEPREWWWRQDQDQWYWSGTDGGTYVFEACRFQNPPSCALDMVNILTSEMRSGWTNYTVEARMKLIDIGIVDPHGRTGYCMGVAFRVEDYVYDRDCEEDSGNGYLFYLIQKDNKRWASLDRVAGTDLQCWEDPRVLVRTPFWYNTGTYHTLRVEVAGSAIKCYVDDVLAIAWEDSTWPTGTVGFYSYGSMVYYDYISIDLGEDYVVAGPGPGPQNPPLVHTPHNEWEAYATPGYGVNVACAKLNQAGWDELLTGPGPGLGYGPRVRGWNIKGVPVTRVDFMAYGVNNFGVNVAAGDLDGDGYDEIVTGPGPGAVFGPHVRGWNFDGGTVEPISAVNFNAYGTKKWGVNVACGDIDGDGNDEILTGPGPGAVFGPHVRGWNYDGGPRTLAISGVNFMAYGTEKGVNVACGDINGQGRDEILTGPGPDTWGAGYVRAWRYLAGNITEPLSNANFFPYPNYRWGVVVSTGQVNDTGRDEILTMPGPGPTYESWARAWRFNGTEITLEPNIDQRAFDSWMKYGGKISGGHIK